MNTDDRIWVQFSVPGETSEHPIIGGAFLLAVPRVDEHVAISGETFRVHHVTWYLRENRDLRQAYVVLRRL